MRKKERDFIENTKKNMKRKEKNTLFKEISKTRMAQRDRKKRING